jgi:hypothetical protein
VAKLGADVEEKFNQTMVFNPQMDKLNLHAVYAAAVFNRIAVNFFT